MTIKEFCDKYNKDEKNIRAKVSRYKYELKDHISKTPYTQTLCLDDYAVEFLLFLLEDRRGRNNQDVSEQPTEEGIAGRPSNVDNLDKIYEICVKHLEEYPSAIGYVPEQYLTEDLCIAALKSKQMRMDYEQKGIWEYIPMDKLTPRVCEVAACYNRYALEHIPDGSKTSKVYFEAVKSFGYLLKDVPIAFHSKEMYINSVSQNGSNLEYVPVEERSEEICKAAFNAHNGGASVEFIPDKYLTEDMCLSAVRSDGKLLDVIPTHYKTAEICLSVLKRSEWVRTFGNSKADDMAFSNYVKKHIPAKVAEEVCERFEEYLLQLKKDEEQENEWRRLVSENPLYIKNIPEDKRSSNICEIAIKREGLALKYVPEEYRCLIYYKWAVLNNPDALLYVPEEMRKAVIDYAKQSCQYVGILFGNSPYKEYFL